MRRRVEKEVEQRKIERERGEMLRGKERQVRKCGEGEVRGKREKWVRERKDSDRKVRREGVRTQQTLT